MIQGASLLSAGLVIGQVISLGRNIITARLLGTEVQGQAMVLSLITGFFATIAVINTAWQLVQSDHAEDRTFQSSIQGVALLRSIGIAILLIAGGLIVINLTDMPELRWPICIVAIVPALEGALNLDAWKRLRDQKFGSYIAFEMAGPVSGAIAACIMLPINRTIWVIVAISVTSAACRCIMSHIVASKPYSIRIHRKHLLEIVQFSWPLIPAGMLYWANTQSDKMIILLSERVEWLPSMDLKALGAYGTVAAMIMIPLSPVGKVVRSVLIPKLSQHKTERYSYDKAFNTFLATMAPFMLATATGAAICGPDVFMLLLGEAFADGAAVSPLLVTAVVIQFIRLCSYQAGLAKGINTPQLVGNLFRLSGFLTGLWMVYLGKGLSGLALSVVLGELISMSGVVLWIRYRAITSVRGILLSIGTVLLIAFMAHMAKQQLPALGNITMVSIGILVSLVVLGAGRIMSGKCLRLMYPGAVN